MIRCTVGIVIAVLGLIMGFVIGIGTGPSIPAAAVAQPVPVGFAAVPGEKGGQDTFGAYKPVADWPKPLSQLREHEKWTWGSTQGVFAEGPNRVFILQRGELPAFPMPESRPVPEAGPNLLFPVQGLPFRNATAASPPAAGASGQLAEDGLRLYKGQFGVDARWEHCLIVVDANGKITEEWTQWDKMLKRPHAIYISPYDPEKLVWVVDDHSHAIFKFSNDGKKLVQTIGTPGRLGADATHFNRPTFIAWLPDGTFFVSDGYNGTRVAKFDKNGKFLLDWGEKGNPPTEARPCYMNNVHGIAVDPRTRRVFVNDRANRRIQVFDEMGKYLYEWSVGVAGTAEIYTIYMGADGYLWGADHTTSKMVKWDANGQLLYSWGTFGAFPGGMWGVHQFSVDQEQNLYVAEVNNGRAQKYRPRQGANPAYLVGKPVYSAWE